jgi:hypothetical protein
MWNHFQRGTASEVGLLWSMVGKKRKPIGAKVAAEMLEP